MQDARDWGRVYCDILFATLVINEGFIVIYFSQKKVGLCAFPLPSMVLKKGCNMLSSITEVEKKDNNLI
jgi:hypothetical protein